MDTNDVIPLFLSISDQLGEIKSDITAIKVDATESKSSDNFLKFKIIEIEEKIYALEAVTKDNVEHIKRQETIKMHNSKLIAVIGTLFGVIGGFLINHYKEIMEFLK